MQVLFAQVTERQAATYLQSLATETMNRAPCAARHFLTTYACPWVYFHLLWPAPSPLGLQMAAALPWATIPLP